ncbi:MAG: ribonuclease P protein component [Polyangia bacterium]
MVHPTDQRFWAGARIRKRAEYLEIQSEGRRVRCGAFVGLVRVRPEGGPRIGITTSRKVGSAVARNRTRRRVREAFRRGMMNLPDGVDLVVVARRGAAEISSAAAFDDLAGLGRSVRRLLGGGK